MKSPAAKILTVTCLAVLAAGTVFADTLDDYQDRISSAIAGTDELIKLIGDGEMEGESRAGKLRRLIPRTEKIDAGAATIETDNSWFHSALESFANETEESKRIETLEAAVERLSAIQAGVDELKAASEAERTKDQDKQKLAEILSRQEYQKPEPQGDSLFQKWWKAFLEWLAKMFPEQMPTPTSGPSFEGLRVVLQVVIFAAVAALIAFLVWRFMPYFARRRRTGKSENGDRVILGERIGEDKSAADIFSEAERLAREGDHRGAIRKGYIALLIELGDRKIVRIARHKTNRDYLHDVRKRDELFTDMSGITSNFERSWYGLRLAGADDWADFRDRCRQAISSVKGSK